MRAVFLFIFSITGVYGLMGQTSSANAWIKYELPYFKITVKGEGIYRITGAQLFAAGFPVTATTDNIALFYRGEEVAVNVAGTQNGKLVEGSYIEFFTQGNTGIQDSLVYRPHSARPPTTFSLYSDECHYFLTVDPNRKGKRMEEIRYQPANAPLEAFHLEHQIKQYQDEWSFNNSNGLVPFLQQSYYENGESRTGKMIQRDSLAKFNISLSQRVKTSDYPIQLKALINGRFDSYHLIDAMVEQRRFATLNFSGFGHYSVSTTVEEDELRTNDEVTLGLKSPLNSQYELYSLTRCEVIYPQRFDMTGKSAKYFYLVPNASNQSTVGIEGLSAANGNSPLMYDVTQPLVPRILEAQLTANRWQATVPGSARERTLFVTTVAQSVASIRKVNFTSYAVGSNYLIITHKALEGASRAYAAYRASAEGGSHQVLIADMEQLTDQFNYGERGPLGIRHFLDYQLRDGQKDKYLLLIGNGVSFPEVLKTWQDRDFVSTFGYPGSDVLLSAGLGAANLDAPTFRTGRICAATNQQVLAYLNKVKEFEKRVPTLSNKNILHLSGGKTPEEIRQLKSILEVLEPIAEKSALGGSVEAFSKRTNEPVENVSIAKQVNEGLGMITFMGHASPTVPDVNIGYASDPTVQLSNKGNYPFMYFNGCGVGNVFYRYATLAADWLLTPDKGAIGVLSNSFWSYPTVSGKYLTSLYTALFDREATLGKPIGEILQKVSHDMAVVSKDPFDLANIHQLILLGDPAVVLFKLNKPDYAVAFKGLFLQSSTPFGQADSLNVGVVVTNTGKAEPAGTLLTIALKLTEANETATANTYFLKAPARKDTFFLRIRKPATIKNIQVMLDAAQQIEEFDEKNNRAELALVWEQIAQYTEYPVNTASDRINPTLEVAVDGRVIPNGAFVSSAPTIQVLLRDDNPLELDTNLVQLYLKSCDACAFSLIPSTKAIYTLQTLQSLQVQYRPGILPAGSYELLVQGKDANGNAAGAPYRIRFRIGNEPPTLSVAVAPNPTQYYVKFLLEWYGTMASEAILRIFNGQGKLEKELSFTPVMGVNELYWQDPPAPGVYTYQCTIGEKRSTGKFTVQ
ncbi:putative type IX secretion system sortase PorU2 [Runella slithyformis]|uniref:Gingipain domain-containing protein n=1 Tax=Runella slithyformis (strain ATCC 29530 / DSM 19594 / LMG 11500 / NCIMB 11436 / LSU 4) TaxID=761193 RepID=A0A7U3ZMC4_RUNSL|nr:C25 family cysteine peptidase [Runella slithyformis]AEI49849.1 hypothetical protein Runsl_3485 [Runella slithyformis DSM 19594]